MKRVVAVLAAMGMAVSAMALTSDAMAGPRDRGEPAPYLTEHPKSGHYRKRGGPQVRGFVSRRGGYSYNYADSVNTYGDSRSLYGSTQLFRHFSYDRQTNAGPFDHGFFFDSGVAPRGGDSPYMH